MNTVNRPTAILLAIMILILGIGVFVMPNERTYYVICEDNCKFESMTKEQIIAAIATSTGHTPSEQDIDQAFITKIKELNANSELKWWVGTEAQYNAIAEKDVHTLYIITDASEYDDMLAEIASFEQTVNQSIEAIADDVDSLDERLTTAEGEIDDLQSSVKVKGDFALLTGNITLANGVGTADISYPTGFNVNNCVVISAEAAVINGAYHFVQGSSNYLIGGRLTDTKVQLTIGAIAGSGASATVGYKLVLMKV